MKYYKITLNSVPKFLFCCAVTVNNYKNSFHKKPDFLEIAVNLEGDMVIKNKDYSRIIEPPALAVHTSLSDYDLYAYENQTQSHITVGIEADYSICEVDEHAAKLRCSEEENVVFLPDILSLEQRERDTLVRKIQKIAYLRNSPSPGSKKKATGEWFDLCAEIEKMRPLSAIDGLRPSAVLYAEKACDYIASHISEKITVAQIADKLGVSAGYAQNTFKKVTGESIIEYVNRRKIETAIEMLRSNKLKMKDIALNLGIDDPAYFSRLFKKVAGVSYEKFSRFLLFERN